MAIKLKAESFIEIVKRSRLVAQDQLQRVLSEAKTAGVDVEDSKEIATTLVDKTGLTRWQADKLLQGKHKGFFLGKYRLLSLLGKGGMGSVYLAEHTLMRRRCAIKVLPAKRVNDTSYLGRFHREAQAVAALDHVNIVRAYDVDKENEGDTEIHFLVMEFVDGRSLLEIVSQDGPMDFIQAADYMRQAADGLTHAHEAGMVHRDIKPGNLLVDESGVVKILDLGLARFFSGEFSEEEESLTVAHDEKVLGTADYLAPEQALDSHSVDSRADIYSLGCTFYYMLTGHPPFTEGTLAQRLMAHQTKEPPSLADKCPGIPADLLAIIQQMMAKNVDERYQSSAEVNDALKKWLLQNADESWRMRNSAIIGSDSSTTHGRNAPSLKNVTAVDAESKAADQVEQSVPPSSADESVQPTTSEPQSAPVVAAPPPQLETAQPQPADDGNLAAFLSNLEVPAEPENNAPQLSPAIETATTDSAAAQQDSQVKNQAAAAPPAEAAPVPVETPPPVAEPEPAPAAATPVQAKPTNAEPAVAKPVEAKPVEAKPVEAKPVVADPVVAQPAAAETVAAKPVKAEPTEAKPVVAQPVEAKPVEAKPAEATPIAARPVPTEPVIASPVVAEPVVAAPVVAAPVVDVATAETANPQVTAPAVGEVPDLSADSVATVQPTERSYARRVKRRKKGPGLAERMKPIVELSKKKQVRVGVAALAGVALLGVVIYAGVSMFSGDDDEEPKPDKTVKQTDDVETDETSDGNSSIVEDVKPKSMGSGKLEVGPGSQFKTISAALKHALENYSPKRLKSKLTIEVSGGSPYSERINVNSGYPPGIHVVAKEGTRPVLAPAGSQPIIKLDGVERFSIEGFDLNAQGKPTAIELTGYLTACQLKNLKLNGFTETGVLSNGATGIGAPNQELRLEQLELRAGNPKAVGMKFQQGNQDTSQIKVSDCRFLSPLSVGFLMQNSPTYIAIRRCIIAEAETGIKFNGSNMRLTGITIGNCTFYKNGRGIVFTSIPSSASHELMISRNLFCELKGLDIVVQEGFDATKMFAMFSSGTDRPSGYNWTTRPEPPNPADGEYNLFTNAGKMGATVNFASTDPGSDRFLAPPAGAPWTTGILAYPRADMKPYVGAVSP